MKAFKLAHVALFTGMLTSLVFTTGCESELTLRQICDEKAELCNDLGSDGHCKNERLDVIFHRYHEAKLPSDKNRHALLLKWEKYSACIELASQIEHIKLKEKKTLRVDGYIVSVNEIKRLSDATVTSDYAPLLYYHWTRNGSNKHLEKFLALEGSKQINTPELVFGLATYYIKRDLPKTVELLYKTLSMYKEGDAVNPEIYSSLSSIYYKLEKTSNAYLWAKVAQLSGQENVNLEELRLEINNQGKTTNGLDKQAQATLDSILDGDFVIPK